MSLHVVKTIRETPPMIIDVTIKLKDGKALVVPAYMTGVNKIYAQYELDVDGMDENAVLRVKGKKTKFVEPSPNECGGQYRVGNLGLVATVALDGKMGICDIPGYAIISIEGENGEEVRRCGAFRGIVGYDVEYRVCLPKDITPEDVVIVR